MKHGLLAVLLVLACQAQALDFSVTYADKHEVQLKDARLVWNYGELAAKPKAALTPYEPVHAKVTSVSLERDAQDLNEKLPALSRTFTLDEIERITFDYRTDSTGPRDKIQFFTLRAKVKVILKSKEVIDVTDAKPVFDLPTTKAFVFNKELELLGNTAPFQITKIRLGMLSEGVAMSLFSSSASEVVVSREEKRKGENVEDTRLRAETTYRKLLAESASRLIKEIVFASP